MAKNNKDSSSSSSKKNKVPRVPKRKGIPIDVPSNYPKKCKAESVKKIAKKVLHETSLPHDHVTYALYTKPMHEQRDILSSPFFCKPKGYNLQRGRLGLEW